MIGRTLKYLSTSIAQRHRKTFLKKFRYEWLNEIKKQINIQVISFSGKKQFADQLYSLTSFYRNVGRPISWNIYSDGSYTSSEIEIFSLIRGVKVSDVNIKKSNIPENYFKKYPTLLKVEILKQFQSHSDTIVFSDSDILFYPKFSEFLDIFQEANWYLVDEGTGYFEPGYKLPQGQQPLNLGLLVLNKPINIDYVILYIAKKINQGSLHYWSDQTAFHQLAQIEHFLPLSKNYFFVGGNDAFSLSHCVDYNEIALRHFVGPVRHKMWQYPWKKVLGIR
jgi:hypothetical protein